MFEQVRQKLIVAMPERQPAGNYRRQSPAPEFEPVWLPPR